MAAEIEGGEVKAVLIDCFGTMVHCPWREIRRSMAERAGVPAERLLHGYKATRQERNTGVHPDAIAELTAVSEAADLLLTTRQLQDLVRFERRLLTVRGDYYPDALRFVARMRARGIPVGLVSNCSPGAASLFERLQPNRHVDDVVLSFQVGHRKPGSRIYGIAQRRLNASTPGSCLFVDDDQTFCRGAKDLGMAVCRVDRSAHEGDAAHGDVVHSLDDLVLAGGRP